MKQLKKAILFALLLAFFVSLASASFDVGNKSHQIDASYSQSSNIRGWINISLEDEPSNSLFTDSRDNSASLINLIRADSEITRGVSYSCVPSDCGTTYSASNSAPSKAFSLQSGVKKLVGFKITGSGVSVSALNLTLTSDASPSLFNQIKLDFLNDGEVEIGNYKTSSEDGIRMTTCFDGNANPNLYDFDSPGQKYCEKIILDEAPAYKVGAWMVRTSASKNITFALYTSNFNLIEGANCNVSGSFVTGEAFCTINYPIMGSADYYMCAYSVVADSNTKIAGYTSNSGCGFYGSSPGGAIKGDYNLSARAKKFDSVGTIRINNILPNENSLGGGINDYLLDKYGSDSSGIDCSGGCVIPLALIPGANQNVNLSGLTLKYSSGGTTSTSNFYDIEEAPAEVNSDGFMQISLDGGNFSVPSSYGNYTFSLDLDDENVLSQKVLIERAPEIYGLNTITTASSVPTLFKVYANTTSVNTTLTEYAWDFGDNDSATTTTNQIMHTYSSLGTYSLKITITDSAQKSSYKIFEIEVVSPKEIINSTLTEKLDDLASLRLKIDTFPDFDKAQLTAIFDTDSLNGRLKAIQTDYATGEKTEEEYNQMITNLLAIKVPESLDVRAQGSSISFYPEREVINLDALKSLGGGSYDPDEVDAYVDAIIAWEQSNVGMKISFSDYSAKYGMEDETVLKTFKIEITKKGDFYENALLVLKQIRNLSFKESYSETVGGGYVSINIKNFPASFVFSTTEDVNFLNLPLFISPPLDDLEVSIINIDNTPLTSNWTIVILALLLLLILALAVYIFLQEWYKKNYETHLFRDRNNLYNLVNYIETSKKKGINEKEIYQSLKRARWNSEQIDYAMKKHAGKRTGMFEIPIGKITRLFRKKEVVQKPALGPGFSMGKFAPNKGF